MKHRTQNNIEAFIAGVLLVIALVLATDAHATKPKPPPSMLEQQQEQYQRQLQEQAQQQALHNANQLSSEAVAAGGSAVNEGNQQDVTISSSYESGPADLVLVPNNNTETCLRVWGLAFGNDSASGMLGIPFRSAKCDFEQAADDAFAAGERELGWFWKCKNRNLAKTFRDKGESWEDAQRDCHDHVIGEMTSQRVIEHLKQRVNQLTGERDTLLEQVSADSESYSRAVKKARRDCSEALQRQHDACQRK